MRAYGFTEYGGPETEAWLYLPAPEPGPGEILVAVRAAGVNPVDWKIRVAAGTAYDAVAQLALGAGDTLLILGIGGGVGVAAAQLARAAGAIVIGTASAAKRTFVESLGATAIPYVRAVFPFDQAAAALRAVESGHAWGKTVLAV